MNLNILKKLNKMICFGFICAVTLGLCGCREKTQNQPSESEVVTFKGVFGVNPETGVADKKEIVDQFNEAYRDRYYFDVEWQMLSTDGYRNHLKQLNVQDKLPIVISDAAMDSTFYQMLIDHHRLVDLAPYMDTEWRGVIQEDILKTCTHEDGAVYLSTIDSPVYSYSGIIYNRQMLREAGYDTIPSDWEGFYECMERLQMLGYTPLALHGGGTYWSPMLLATACAAQTEAGRAFLNQEMDLDFDNDESRRIFECLKRQFDYSFPDALEIDYETAQARFYAGKAAMLANGYWILEAMDEEQQNKYGFAPFPGNVMMVSPKMTAWAVTTGYSDEETEAAVEFLRFRTMVSSQNSRAFLESKGTPVMQDYKSSIINLDHIFPNYQLGWPQKIQNEFFNEYIPLYVQDAIDLDEFIVNMNKMMSEIS